VGKFGPSIERLKAKSVSASRRPKTLKVSTIKKPGLKIYTHVTYKVVSTDVTDFSLERSLLQTVDVDEQKKSTSVVL